MQSPLPIITDVIPSGATYGTLVTLYGTNLLGSDFIEFGGITIQSSSYTSTDTTIQFTVPYAVNQGIVLVGVVYGYGSTVPYLTPAKEFTYLYPTLNSVTPTSDIVGTVLQLMGANLLGSLYLMIGTTKIMANAYTSTDNDITFTAEGDNQGPVPIRVFYDYGSTELYSTNAIEFTYVYPIFTSIDPVSGIYGTFGITVNIYGTNLDGSDYIDFGGIIMPSSSYGSNSTNIQFSLPNGVKPGINKIKAFYKNLDYSPEIEFTYEYPTLNRVIPDPVLYGRIYTLKGEHLQNSLYLRFMGLIEGVSQEVKIFPSSYLLSDDTTIQFETPVMAPGVITLQVIYEEGDVSSPLKPEISFTYNYPTLIDIIPTHAFYGNTVTIFGEYLRNLHSSLYVMVGNNQILESDYISYNDGSIQFNVPNGLGQYTVSVKVFYANGTEPLYSTNALEFTYMYPTTFTRIHPTNGWFGNHVTIEGSHLLNSLYLMVGDTKIQSNNYTSTDGSIQFYVPNGLGQTNVHVKAFYANGTATPYSTNALDFTYVYPTFTHITPTHALGGTPVIIEGRHLMNSLYLMVGNTKILKEEYNYSTNDSIEFNVPNGLGQTNVSVKAFYANGYEPLYSTNALGFTYIYPTIDQLNPNKGPSGSPVELNGQHLNDILFVQFGSTQITNFEVVSNENVSLTVPNGSGIASVSLGYNPNNRVDFTYTNPSITRINPDRSTPYQTIVIEGNYLDQTYSVKFGPNYTSTFFIDTTSGYINCSVPLGSGNVSVVVTDIYKNTTTGNFIYDSTVSVTEARQDATTCRILSNEIKTSRDNVSAELVFLENHIYLNMTRIEFEFKNQIDYVLETENAAQSARETAAMWNNTNTTLNEFAAIATTKAFETATHNAEVLRDIPIIRSEITTARAYFSEINLYNTSALQKATDAENAATSLESGSSDIVYYQIIENSLNEIQGQGPNQGYISNVNRLKSSFELLQTNVTELFNSLVENTLSAKNARQAAFDASTQATTFSQTLPPLDPVDPDPVDPDPVHPAIDCIVPILDASGNLYTIGNNTFGQAGLGNTIDQSSLTFNTTQVSSVGTTRKGMMYLKNGILYFSGENQYGELGNLPRLTVTSTPSTISNITQFSAGLDHVLLLDQQKQVYSMGLNTYGQLGTGNTNASTPQLISTVNLPCIQLATGLSHSAILDETLRVHTFGRNQYGQLGYSDLLSNLEVTQVACGANHTLFLSKEKVYACGNNASGQLGLPMEITQTNQPTLIPGLSHMVYISSAGDTSAALDVLGNLWVWGEASPTIVKTQVTHVQVTLMGIFYVSNEKYYVMNSQTPLPNGPIAVNSDPLFRIQSNICFPADTPVTTDQGEVSIQDLTPGKHTIRGNPVVAITETYSSERDLIVFEKDALFLNYPSKRTVITREHRVFYECEWREAYTFLNGRLVYEVSYQGDPLYNVLLEEHGRMKVNNMIVETLDPNNTIGKIFKKYQEVKKIQEVQKDKKD